MQQSRYFLTSIDDNEVRGIFFDFRKTLDRLDITPAVQDIMKSTQVERFFDYYCTKVEKQAHDPLNRHTYFTNIVDNKVTPMFLQHIHGLSEPEKHKKIIEVACFLIFFRHYLRADSEHNVMSKVTENYIKLNPTTHEYKYGPFPLFHPFEELTSLQRVSVSSEYDCLTLPKVQVMGKCNIALFYPRALNFMEGTFEEKWQRLRLKFNVFLNSLYRLYSAFVQTTNLKFQKMDFPIFAQILERIVGTCVKFNGPLRVCDGSPQLRILRFVLEQDTPLNSTEYIESSSDFTGPISEYIPYTRDDGTLGWIVVYENGATRC